MASATLTIESQQQTKVLKREDFFISLERSRRALQDVAIRFVIGQSALEQ